MNTEREQLTLAAKACGIEGMWVESTQGIQLDTGPLRWVKYWNPLTDDGDALRLAVKCGISFEWVNRADYPDPMQWASSPVGLIAGPDDVAKYGWVTTFFGDDAYAATRRAIVRAAAEIGRAM